MRVQIGEGSEKNERYQTQLYTNDPRGWTWYITKGQQWELWGLTGRYIRLYADTSPGEVAGAENGVMAYRVTDAAGLPGGRWAERFMKLGQRFIEQRTHQVQFFRKQDGSQWDGSPTGNNRNQTKLFSRINGVIAIGKEVTELHGEMHEFDLVGRLTWNSPWGSSVRSTDVPGTHNNEREKVDWLLKDWFKPF